MANWVTAVEKVLRKLNLDATTTGSGATTDVKIALIDAMNYHNSDPWWFNKIDYKLATANSQFRYPLPGDFVSLTGAVLFNSESEPTSSRRKLRYRPVDWAEEQKWRGTTDTNSINTGPPAFYSIDETTNEMLLIPVPNLTGETVEFRYLSDGQIPEYVYNGTTWLFYYPHTQKALIDTFQNKFLEYGSDMIIYRACMTLMAGEYDGGEETQAKLSDMRAMWDDEQRKLIAEGTRRASVSEIIPRLR